MASLADRLKALGVKVGAADLTPRPADRYEIDAVVPGASIPTRAGETFVHEEKFAADYQHGQTPIRLEASLEMLAAWAADARLRELPVESFAFLDTETSGLAGGTGTYAFLVGAGRFVNGEFVLQQFFMRDPAQEPALLEGLAGFLAPAQALVTFNGKAFDAPLLKTRYLLHSIPVPFADYAHLDLLPLARRLWRDRLPSRALKYLEENILAAPRTSDEVSGYEIPWLYFDYLRTGDARPLKGVFYHNAMDVVALAALLSHTAAMLADPFSEAIQHGLDVIALAKLFEDVGQWETAARLFERGLEMGPSTGSPVPAAGVRGTLVPAPQAQADGAAPWTGRQGRLAHLCLRHWRRQAGQALGQEDFWQAVRRLSVLQKRRGDFEQAVELWEKAAAEGHIYAYVELAKYYEHRRRDPAQALKWTQLAWKKVKSLDLPRYVREHWLQELEHRRTRLENKLASRD